MADKLREEIEQKARSMTKPQLIAAIAELEFGNDSQSDLVEELMTRFDEGAQQIGDSEAHEEMMDLLESIPADEPGEDEED